MKVKPLLIEYGRYSSNTANGVNEQIYHSAHLLKDEFRVTFINFDLPVTQSYQKIHQDGFEIHLFPVLKYFNLIFPQSFLDWLDDLESDSIFHLHSVFRLANFSLARLLHQRGFKYIFTPHDSYSPESIKKRFFLKRLFLKTFEKYVLERAQLIHAITEIGAEHIRSYTTSPIQTVHNFIPDPQLALSPYQPDADICFVGRFDIYQKGLDQLFLAYQGFREQSEKGIELHLIGRSSPEQCKQLQKLLGNIPSQIRSGIKISGFLEKQEKDQGMYQAYVYCQLSRFEGFSLSVVEALALSKPVIISREIPISRYIAQYQAGYVVDTIEEASQALLDIYQLPKKVYLQRSQNARHCYEELFHPNNIKEQLIDMFNQAFQPLKKV